MSSRGFPLKVFLPLTGIEPVFQLVDVDASVLEDFEDDLHQRQPVRLILRLQLPSLCCSISMKVNLNLCEFRAKPGWVKQVEPPIFCTNFLKYCPFSSLIIIMQNTEFSKILKLKILLPTTECYSENQVDPL